VTRTIAVPEDAGSLEIVVGRLPEQVVPNSLFAEGGDAVEIRAVRYRTYAVSEEPREEVRELDRKILGTQQQIDLNNKRIALLAQRSGYLNRLEGFVAPTALADLAKGVLDAEALERISQFAFAQHEKIAEEQVALAQQGHDLGEQLALLQRKRAQITSDASLTEREAVLFLEKHAPGSAEVRLNYLVANCGWSPTYTMRSRAVGARQAGVGAQQVRVEYNALVHQLTGEDWDGVTLTLSTASPALSATGPGLAPFHVTLASFAANQPQSQSPNSGFALGGKFSERDMIQAVDKLSSQRYEAEQAASKAVAFDEVSRLSWALNDFSCTLQQLELNGDEIALGVLRNETHDDSNGPSLSYRLRGNVSLASRSDQQMVRIMQTEMPSHLYHVAVPVLTSYVYREAELTNTSDEDLLAGPMSVYLDGRFVGQSDIPTVARGQTFVVGFGADPQLRTRRELADKEDDVQGGNRETRFDYRLVVENFTGQAIAVRVLDRLPHAENGVDIRITLGETSDPISRDKLYQRQERPMGILRWDIEVPAGAAGEDARLVEYQYTVEYDRQFVVSLPTAKQTLEEEFRRLQRGRQIR
jgi:hypothetical protein